MTVATMFFVFIGLLIICAVGAIFNFYRAMGTKVDFDNGFKPVLLCHVILAIMCAIACGGAMITGVIWIVQQFKS